MLEMRRKFPPVSEEQLKTFERELGRPLPCQYRRFLLITNGGRPQKEEFIISSAECGDILNFFYGIGVGDDYGLMENWGVFEGRIADDLLPIAEDPFGNQICISLSSDDCGKMYFWDHEVEFTPDRAITPLDRTFDEFIDSLSEAQE